jgi:hypothetical protein
LWESASRSPSSCTKLLAYYALHVLTEVYSQLQGYKENILTQKLVNVYSHRGTYIEGAEENTWTMGRGSKMKLQKMHREELHNLFSSLNTDRMIKSRRK